ncbi:MAG: ABC transporter permease [Armatimonadetes bacterium]|nr:ABC transporter permease [Armatimonadota bacterium]
MGFFESFRVAVDMLRLHKLRAFLTMLGVIIGVASVMLIVEISDGFKKFLLGQIEELGTDTIIVFFDPGKMRGQGFGRIDKLTNDDIDYIQNRTTTIGLVSGILQGPADEIRHGDRTLKSPRVICTDQNQAQLSKVGIAKGRHLSENDLKYLANVCVIGDETAETLYGKDDPLGQTLTMKGMTLQVVGVMERIDIMGQTNGKDVWIPITTAQKKWIGGEMVSYITCKPKDGVAVNTAMDDVWEVLMRKSGGRPLYRVDSRESMLKVLGTIVQVIGVVLAGIAALSLLVGGIGIMNIMLVSVTERTREIGLRKAVGARRSAILAQFLVESALLSLVGGLIGMFFAFAIGQAVTVLTAISKTPPPNGISMPFNPVVGVVTALYSALIGVVFGIYPAARAARLSPIEALRTE